MKQDFNPKIKSEFLKSFKLWCQQAVIEGYRQMITDATADFTEWEEENISARLVAEMKRLPFLREKRISVNRDHYLDDESILSGKRKAKSAPRIDFIFSNWTFREEPTTYFAEAKNVSEYDWRKVSGSRVSSSESIRYYVNEGIERFVSGKYPDGFIIAYTVRGDFNVIVSKLNALIKKRSLPPRIGTINQGEPIEKHPACFCSNNQRSGQACQLIHIFLDFQDR